MHTIINTKTKTVTRSWVEDFVNQKTGKVTER